MSHEDEVLKYRQANCKHAFVRGIPDKVARCVHCGLSEHDYVPTVMWGMP